MHGVSVHSALAIKRQRKKRALSSSSSGRSRRRAPPSSTSDNSLASYLARQEEGQTANKVMGTITMLHIGTIFTLIGILLILATFLTNQTPSEMAELIGTGIICLVIGLFLIILNRIYGRREEEDLEHYVEARLGRNKEGERFVADTELV